MSNETSIPSPPSRVYVHRGCGGSTQISGEYISQLANPFALCRETTCSSCRKDVKLNDVYWEDTGEDLKSYRKRLRSQAPMGVKIFGILGPLLAAGIGFGAGRLFKPSELAIPIFVALGVALFFWAALMPPLIQAIWKIDYRQTT
jgi:hypothetical protein